MLGDTIDNFSFVGTSNHLDSGYTYDDFLVTCAHEIGHQLGLSTHSQMANPALGSGKPFKTAFDSEKTHDYGQFPKDWYYLLNGAPVPYEYRKDRSKDKASNRRMDSALMSQGTPPGAQYIWIRHEDWEQANKAALGLGNK